MSEVRADGHTTPMLVYDAVRAGKGCAPLAVISHGAGGTENGYVYLARAMAQMGYTTVVMGHRESGPEAMRVDILRHVPEAVESRKTEQARLLDVGAALKWADEQCRSPFRVLLGHSMGSETVMLEAGAKNIVGVTSPPSGQDRFDAYVALSPEGPGNHFPDHAWTKIRKPVLALTGTQDLALNGRGWESRLIPWKEMPGSIGKCQWMAVIDGAKHMNFAGAGAEAGHVNAMAMATVGSFLDGARKGNCPLPAVKAGMTVQAK
ncbi:alpha/beta hydrolase family protein [Edaphobacter bradus]|uniref:alpha/beta hydrolase family protein n=1 Tax=Edaphobacter bradus TaxID=2259016 RepID=UPI0021DFA902|nr:hypothetical protein [Edaphobacter bradus]